MLKLSRSLTVEVDKMPEVRIKYISHSCPDAVVATSAQGTDAPFEELLTMPLSHFGKGGGVRYTHHPSGVGTEIIQGGAQDTSQGLRAHVITSRVTGNSMYLLEDSECNLFVLGAAAHEGIRSMHRSTVETPGGLGMADAPSGGGIGRVSHMFADFDCYPAARAAMNAAKNVSSVSLKQGHRISVYPDSKRSGSLRVFIEREPMKEKARSILDEMALFAGLGACATTFAASLLSACA
jgi:hypothetical protein